MLINPVPRMDAELSIPRIADAFLVEGKGSVVATLYCWSKSKLLGSLFEIPMLTDNTELFQPNENHPEFGTDYLFEVDVGILNPFLVTNQMDAKRLTWSRTTLTKILEKGYDSIIVTEHDIVGGTHNYVMLLNTKETYLRSKYLGYFGEVGGGESKPTILYLEQTDIDRIKEERDKLAKAIGTMAIKLGHVRPDATLSGPHLLQICEDVTTSYKTKE